VITDPEVDAAPHSRGSETVEPCVRYEELIQVIPLVVNVCGNALQCDEALEPIETVLAGTLDQLSKKAASLYRCPRKLRGMMYLNCAADDVKQAGAAQERDSRISDLSACIPGEVTNLLVHPFASFQAV